MAYVDLMVGAVVVAVFSAFAWAFGSIWSAWKEDTAKAGLLKDEFAPKNQQPRAVSWEEFDGLRSRVAQMQKWAHQDHFHDQQIMDAVKTLDRKIGKRFCIKWTEEFTSHCEVMEPSFTRNFVWGDNFSMSDSEAWHTLEKIKQDSKDNFNLVLVTVEGRATLVTSRIQVRCAGAMKHTYWVEEVKI